MPRVDELLDRLELEADMPEKYTVSLSYASPRVVHTALGRPDSPIPQGMDEEQSLINLKLWVEGVVVVGEVGAGGADYSGMDTSQYHRIVIGLSQLIQMGKLAITGELVVLQ